MKIKLSMVALICFAGIFTPSWGDELSDEDLSQSQWSKKQVLILQSTTDYAAARRRALEAGGKLGEKVDFRNLEPNKDLGLSLSEQECKDQEDGYPCYPARGRHDDGAFVSIEYSNAFRGFKPGYYIVVAAMASVDDKKLIADAFKKAKAIYPDAYIKTTHVYIGCMH